MTAGHREASRESVGLIIQIDSITLHSSRSTPSIDTTFFMPPGTYPSIGEVM